MSSTQSKEIIMLGCFGGDGKRGGIRTYVESLSVFLIEQNYRITQIPKSQIAKSSYSCLIKIKIDSMKVKIPSSAVAIAQRPDNLLMFKLFNKKNKAICVMHSDNLRQIDMKKNKAVARIFRIMEKQGLKRADKIVCVDQGTYDVYVKRYQWIKSKSIIIPVGVNTSNFTPGDRDKSRETLDIPKDAKVMLVAARMEKEKNVGAAIKLIKDYFDLDNHFLLIAGTGTQEHELKTLAQGTKKLNVKFLGQVKYENLPNIMSACDVVLVPSLLESGPLIIIEAMACGIPSVSTNVGRAKIFIGDSGCGAVMNSVDKEFAEKMKSFLEPNIELKKKCIERVKKFSFHNTGVEMVKVIEKMR